MTIVHEQIKQTKDCISRLESDLLVRQQQLEIMESFISGGWDIERMTKFGALMYKKWQLVDNPDHVFDFASYSYRIKKKYKTADLGL